MSLKKTRKPNTTPALSGFFHAQTMMRPDPDSFHTAHCKDAASSPNSNDTQISVHGQPYWLSKGHIYRAPLGSRHLQSAGTYDASQGRVLLEPRAFPEVLAKQEKLGITPFSPINRQKITHTSIHEHIKRM